MPTKKTIHDEPTEEYKAALAAKEAQKKKEEQDAKAAQIRKRQTAAKAKREMEARKKELQTELANKKIAGYSAKIAKAEKALESEKVYDSIAKIALGFFAFMMLLTIGVMIAGLGVDVVLVSMSIALLILCFSIFFQVKPNFAKKEIAENRRQIAKVRQALYAVKNRR